MCALGRMSIRLSSEPAGTISKPTSGWETGRADPHSEQKLFVWRVPESRKILIFSSPETQVRLAVGENKLAEWAEPLPLRQREQWHRKKLSKVPEMWNCTVPQRHSPVARLLTIHTPLNKQVSIGSQYISFCPFTSTFCYDQKGSTSLFAAILCVANRQSEKAPRARRAFKLQRALSVSLRTR